MWPSRSRTRRAFSGFLCRSTLLAAAALGLMPQALASLPPQHAFATLLAGILTFFILEKLVLLRHCHDDAECKVHKAP